MKMTPSQIDGPVRKISINSRSVTGTVPKMGKYESTLERDLMEILRFDPEVEQFIPQPMTIEFHDKDGKKRSYTPDGLIRFRPPVSNIQPPILFEVKYREDFRNDWKNLLPKFRAAKAVCLERGWRFLVYTEREIRTPYLLNVKFLWQFLEQVPEDGMRSLVLQVLNDLDEADPDLLLHALCRDAENRARFIPIIWHLVATGEIECDLGKPINMRSIIRTRGGV